MHEWVCKTLFEKLKMNIKFKLESVFSFFSGILSDDISVVLWSSWERGMNRRVFLVRRNSFHCMTSFELCNQVNISWREQEITSGTPVTNCLGGSGSGPSGGCGLSGSGGCGLRVRWVWSQSGGCGLSIDVLYHTVDAAWNATACWRWRDASTLSGISLAGAMNCQHI